MNVCRSLITANECILLLLDSDALLSRQILIRKCRCRAVVVLTRSKLRNVSYGQLLATITSTIVEGATIIIIVRIIIFNEIIL